MVFRILCRCIVLRLLFLLTNSFRVLVQCFEPLCVLQAQSLLRRRNSSSCRDCGCIVLFHLTKMPSSATMTTRCGSISRPFLSLTSLSARLRNLLGTFLTLWLAVLRLITRGTCWKALMVSAFLVFCMLFSKALISYSRALTNEATSSSPVVEMAASLDCTEISLMSWVFWRFRLAEDVGIAFRLRPSASFVAEVMTLSKSSRGSELTQTSISQVSSLVESVFNASRDRGDPASRYNCML